jgi:hypothetical protein
MMYIKEAVVDTVSAVSKRESGEVGRPEPELPHAPGEGLKQHRTGHSEAVYPVQS